MAKRKSRSQKNKLGGLVSDTQSIRSMIGKALMFPVQVLVFPFKPITSFLAKSKKRLTRMGVRGWLTLFTATIAVLAVGYFFGPQLLSNFSSRDLQLAEEARESGDYKTAISHFEKYQKNHEPTADQRFLHAQLLSKTGGNEKANSIIDELAPVGRIGYAKAHLIKALNIGAQLKSKNRNLTKDRPELLKELRWHLEHCADESPATQETWAILHAILGETDEAIARLSRSAKVAPVHYLMIADICNSKKRYEQRDALLGMAETELLATVKEAPLEVGPRLILARVLDQLGKQDEALEVLEKGVKITPNPMTKRALATFHLRQFDTNRKDATTEEQMDRLTKALELEPKNPDTFIRVMPFHAKIKDQFPKAARRLQETIERLADSENQSAMAHASLWQMYDFAGDEKKVIYHLERALKLQPNLPLAANNLAWKLAHQEPPQLERALELAESARKSLPNSFQICDTLGTIHFKMNHYKEASQEFQAALQATPNNVSLHKKLAGALEKLDMKEMAKVHRTRAKELEAKKLESEGKSTE